MAPAAAGISARACSAIVRVVSAVRAPRRRSSRPHGLWVPSGAKACVKRASPSTSSEARARSGQAYTGSARSVSAWPSTYHS